jgi:phytol kinase
MTQSLERMTVRFLEDGLLSLGASEAAWGSAIAAALVAVSAAAAAALHRRGWPVAYTRKIFHFLIFTSAAVLQTTRGLGSVVLFGLWTSAAVLAAVMRGRGFAFYDALARPKDAPHASRFITLPLLSTAAGGVLSNLFFPGTAFVGYWAAGWADAVAEPVGSRWGRHAYRVPSLFGVPAKRTLEGSLAVFLAALAAGLASAAVLTLGPAPAMRFAAGVAAATVAVEASSPHGLDNLTVQVAAAATAFLLLP